MKKTKFGETVAEVQAVSVTEIKKRWTWKQSENIYKDPEKEDIIKKNQ